MSHEKPPQPTPIPTEAMTEYMQREAETVARIQQAEATVSSRMPIEQDLINTDGVAPISLYQEDPYSDIHDLVKVGDNPDRVTLHRPDGSFMSRYELEQIQENQDLIRNNPPKDESGKTERPIEPIDPKIPKDIGGMAVAYYSGVPKPPRRRNGYLISKGRFAEDALKVHIKPKEPGVSFSGYHKPLGAGEKRFITQEDIDRENGERPITEVRESIIEESFKQTMEDNPDAPIPEIIPVFLGLRKAINRMRLERAERIIRDLEEDKLVNWDIEEGVDNGTSYMRESDPLRPQTDRQKRTAKKVEEHKTRRKNLGAVLEHLKRSVGPDVGTEEFVDRIDGRPISVKERMSYMKSHRDAKRNVEEIEEKRKKSIAMIDRPAKKQQRHLRRHAKIEARLRAIEDAATRR